MDIYAHFRDRIVAALDALAASGDMAGGLDCSRIVVEPPRDSSHGDIATNAAMVLAKPAGLKPRELADLIAARLVRDDDIEAADVAGPGFINIAVTASFWPRIVGAVMDQREAFGHSDIGHGEKVNVEYVSVNPTGPLHIGHARGAVFGDALANLLSAMGWDVTREYYINDAGVQVDNLARSAYLRYREARGQDIGEIPSGLYPGAYLKPVGEALAGEHGDALLDAPEAEWLAPVRAAAIDAMMAVIREDLAALRIEHDVFFSERSMSTGDHDEIAETIAGLTADGLVYEGRLPPPKGQLPEDWEDREQTLFRATQFGDDIDRPLLKSDGSYTYFAGDIAYHRDKYRRGFNQMIDVWGADHGGYVKRMKSAVAAISGGKAELDIKLCQLVRLFRSGELIKMSKRAGDFVTLRDAVDEVGPDVVRFMMLYRKNDAPLDFDFTKVLEHSRENPVFYVQYAHARVHSVFRNAREALPDQDLGDEALGRAMLDKLGDEAEVSVIKSLAAYPRMLAGAAAAHEPHRIAFYLYDLASEFHSLWNKGKELPQLRFISEDLDVTFARLALVRAVGHVLAGGLKMLGVEPLDEMR